MQHKKKQLKKINIIEEYIPHNLFFYLMQIAGVLLAAYGLFRLFVAIDELQSMVPAVIFCILGVFAFVSSVLLNKGFIDIWSGKFYIVDDIILAIDRDCGPDEQTYDVVLCKITGYHAFPNGYTTNLIDIGWHFFVVYSYGGKKICEFSSYDYNIPLELAENVMKVENPKMQEFLRYAVPKNMYKLSPDEKQYFMNVLNGNANQSNINQNGFQGNGQNGMWN